MGHEHQLNGQSIMEEVDKLDSGWKDSEAELKMMLKNKSGQLSERFLRIKSLEINALDKDNGVLNLKK